MLSNTQISFSKTVFVAVILLVSSLGLALAQSPEVDVIYLKNGSVVKGKIVEQIPNESIKVETDNGSTMIFRMDEIEKMTKESNSGTESLSPLSLANPNSTRKFEHLLDAGFAYDLEYGFASMGRYVLNYRISPNITVGPGLGILYDSYEGLALPVFLNAHAYAFKGAFTPYLSVSGGYQIGLSDYGTGMFDVTGGLRLLGSSYGYTIELGYRNQYSEGMVVVRAGYIF